MDLQPTTGKAQAKTEAKIRAKTPADPRATPTGLFHSGRDFHPGVPILRTEIRKTKKHRIQFLRKIKKIKIIK